MDLLPIKFSSTKRLKHIISSQKRPDSRHETGHSQTDLKEQPNTVLKCTLRLVSKRHTGYSLIELMISCTLMALLITFAVPSFASMLERSKLNASASELRHSLSLARLAAMNHMVRVIICPKIDKLSSECADVSNRNQVWSNGWQVYIDRNSNNEYDDSDQLLHHFTPNEQTAVVFNQKGRLRFFPDGSARSAGFYICTRNSHDVRHIKLLHSGRVRRTQNSTEKVRQLCANALN